MNSLSRWWNLLAELIFAFMNMGIVLGIGWITNQPVPSWALFLAASIGIIQWSRPTYSRKNDFDK